MLSMTWSPDGKYIAIVMRNNTITMIDAVKSKVMKRLTNAYEINEVRWTDDSSYFLMQCSRGGVGFIDVCAFDSSIWTLNKVYV